MIRRFDFVVVDVDAGVPLAHRRAYAAAQQIQLREHIAPAWQGDPTMCVRVATPEAPPLDGEVEIRLLRDPTQAGAIGFHDQKPDGTPIAYVFVQLAEHLGEQWTKVASHEVVEIVGDPRLRLCVELEDGFWDRELADRVEADQYAVTVTVDGASVSVWLSNFNYPSAFEPPKAPAPDEKYDYMGLSTHANEVRPGGYGQKFDPSKGWVQVQNGERSAYRAHLESHGIGRGARRRARNPRSWWRRVLAALGLGR